ncbi:MAG: endonuclease domain-containing protein, partial [Sphingomonas sp.]|nr:endonuclease domain-containing protein [Sphingomonas sp.]
MPHFRQRPTLRAQELRNNATDAERKLWRTVSRSQLGHKFSRQMPVGPFIIDFMCRQKRLVIELDGGQHADSPKDEARTRFIEAQGFRVIRFWNNDVMANIEGVIWTVSEALKLPPPPTPSRMREGKENGSVTRPSRSR